MCPDFFEMLFDAADEVAKANDYYQAEGLTVEQAMDKIVDQVIDEINKDERCQTN
jgi:hypothetical protein